MTWGLQERLRKGRSPRTSMGGMSPENRRAKGGMWQTQSPTKTLPTTQQAAKSLGQGQQTLHPTSPLTPSTGKIPCGQRKGGLLPPGKIHQRLREEFGSQGKESPSGTRLRHRNGGPAPEAGPLPCQPRKQHPLNCISNPTENLCS